MQQKKDVKLNNAPTIIEKSCSSEIPQLQSEFQNRIKRELKSMPAWIPLQHTGHPCQRNMVDNNDACCTMPALISLHQTSCYDDEKWKLN